MSMNPRIKSIDLGIRTVQTYQIYPLSMADEFRVTDILTKAANEYNKMESTVGVTDQGAIKLIVALIKDNLEVILTMVTDEDNRPSLEDVDNYQFSELVDLIFEMNFANTIKNFQSLVEKVKNLFPSMRPSAPLSEEVVTD